MDNKSKIDMYSKFYFTEIERKEKLYSRLNITFFIAAACISLWAFMLKGFSLPPSCASLKIFFLLFLISVVSILSSFFYVFQFMFVKTDSLCPSAKTMQAYHGELQDHFLESDDAEKHTLNAFESFLIDSYISYSSVNFDNNNFRNSRLYYANLALGIALIAAFVSLVPFFIISGALEPNHSSTIEQKAMSQPNKPLPTPPGPVSVRGGVIIPSQPSAGRPSPQNPPTKPSK